MKKITFNKLQEICRKINDKIDKEYSIINEYDCFLDKKFTITDDEISEVDDSDNHKCKSIFVKSTSEDWLLESFYEDLMKYKYVKTKDIKNFFKWK